MFCDSVCLILLDIKVIQGCFYGRSRKRSVNQIMLFIRSVFQSIFVSLWRSKDDTLVIAIGGELLKINVRRSRFVNITFTVDIFLLLFRKVLYTLTTFFEK